MQKRQNKNVSFAYFGFILSEFIRKPSSYITALVYLLYLSIILVIVPLATHSTPLFIWGVSSFNMQIYNLLFVASITASMVVNIFRLGKEDGTELIVASKPISRLKFILLKFLLFITILVIFSGLAIAVSCLVLIFGAYDPMTNPTGMDMSKFVSLILSLLIGNIINMLIFGSIATLVSMIGNTTFILIITLSVSFILSFMSFIFPKTMSMPQDVIQNEYAKTISSYAGFTTNQINNNSLEEQKSFKIGKMATIETKDEDQFDTAEYWNKANSLSKIGVTNYIDLGSQLSSLYSSFGLEQDKLESAQKSSIGASTKYKYNIDPKTKVSLPENVDNQNYPVHFYDREQTQGKTMPKVYFASSLLNASKFMNWEIVSSFFGIKYDAITIMSSKEVGTSFSTQKEINGGIIPSTNLEDISSISAEERKEFQTLAKKLYEDALTIFKDNSAIATANKFRAAAYKVISELDVGILFDKKWEDLKDAQRFDIISRIKVEWLAIAQEKQQASIEYVLLGSAFPYSSDEILSWKKTIEDGAHQDALHEDNFARYVFNANIPLAWDSTTQKSPQYCNVPMSSVLFCETFNNIYSYNAVAFFSTYHLIAIWGTFAIVMYAISIVIYSKTDLK